jgi:transcriptional regulator with XRE-family HTH domain
MSTLGDRLRLSREKKGFSQTEVYRRTNINNKTLSKYEKDDTNPDIETIKLLADFYEVNVQWLITGDHPAKITTNDDDELDPDVRTLAREIQSFDPANRGLLKDIVKSMKKRGREALDE